MKIAEQFHMDTRLVDRNIRQGIVQKSDYEAHLANLPDVADSAEALEIEMSDVGVKNVEAKETGETE